MGTEDAQHKWKLVIGAVKKQKAKVATICADIRKKTASAAMLGVSCEIVEKQDVLEVCKNKPNLQHTIKILGDTTDNQNVPVCQEV